MKTLWIGGLCLVLAAYGVERLVAGDNGRAVAMAVPINAVFAAAVTAPAPALLTAVAPPRVHRATKRASPALTAADYVELHRTRSESPPALPARPQKSAMPRTAGAT